MAQQVRVRYAPSPTGEPHIGNIRTALFNWLFARHHRGAFVVRIEDTDRERYVEGAVERILEGLRWLGLDWDEGPQVDGPYGPYVQSERLELYHRYAMELRERGYAYHCYCSPRRLEAMRREQQRQGRPPGYDRRCRDLSPEECQRREAENATPVVRFKVPLSGETTFQDAIRGPVTFQNGLLDDFVVLKSDGFPTYHLASVVDDHLMEMSHVIRGEEWLSSTPRHVLLYEALGWEHPIFAHLPMILGPDRAKLSKRHGATSVLEYREAGYLPDALVNFMALLGWSLDDRTELLSRGELVQHFSLERVSRSAAIFNQEKLLWMNGVYLRQMGQEELAEQLVPFLERGLPPGVPRPLDRAYLRRIVPLVQERLKLLGEAASLTGFFFVERLEYDASLLLQVFLEPLQKEHRRGRLPSQYLPLAEEPERARQHLTMALAQVQERLASCEPFNAPTLEGLIRPLAEEVAPKAALLFQAIRVATTGLTAAPPLFETMEVLGRQRCLQRIEEAVHRLETPTGRD